MQGRVAVEAALMLPPQEEAETAVSPAVALAVVARPSQAAQQAQAVQEGRAS
jgi:hypothetical protein